MLYNIHSNYENNCIRIRIFIFVFVLFLFVSVCSYFVWFSTFIGASELHTHPENDYVMKRSLNEWNNKFIFPDQWSFYSSIVFPLSRTQSSQYYQTMKRGADWHNCWVHWLLSDPKGPRRAQTNYLFPSLLAPLLHLTTRGRWRGWQRPLTQFRAGECLTICKPHLGIMRGQWRNWMIYPV